MFLNRCFIESCFVISPHSYRCENLCSYHEEIVYVELSVCDLRDHDPSGDDTDFSDTSY